MAEISQEWQDTCSWARASRSPSRRRLLLVPSGYTFFFVANLLFFVATRIFLPCGVVECRLMLKKLTIFLWCAYI